VVVVGWLKGCTLPKIRIIFR
jgi:hypothetical protein